MLNKNIDVDALGSVYRQNAAVVIQNIMEPQAAERIRTALAGADWFLEIKDYQQSELFRIPLPAGYDRNDLLGFLRQHEHSLNTDNLFFMRLCMNTEEFSDPALTELQQFIESDRFIDVMKQITGMPHIRTLWCEATCYDRCCFLNGHRDDHHPDNSVAFVLNFSRHWQLDWGGILMLANPNAPPTLVMPYWNSLSMFSVPRDHLVTTVSPGAKERRYSVTGWLRK